MIALLAAAVVAVVAGVVIWQFAGARMRELQAAEFRQQIVLPIIPTHTWQPALAADVAMSVDRVGATLPDNVPELLHTVLQYSGDARENVVAPQSTTINGTSVMAFDHVFRARGSDGQMQVEHDACVKFAIGVPCPLTIVTARHGGNEHGITLSDDLHRVTLPSDDFNRTYNVATYDTHFVLSLFDAAMIEWFLADLRLHTIVFSGTDVLVSFSAPGGRSSSMVDSGVPVSLVDPEPTDPDLALSFVAGFLERIPPAVGSEFGAPTSS